MTDAAASDKVRTVDVPDAANVPATYAGVVVKASPNPDAAEAFLDWFAGPDGQAILPSFGFLPPRVVTRRSARQPTRSRGPHGRGEPGPRPPGIRWGEVVAVGSSRACSRCSSACRSSSSSSGRSLDGALRHGRRARRSSSMRSA